MSDDRWSRRRYLGALAAGGVAVAGCSAPAGSQSERPTGDPATPGRSAGGAGTPGGRGIYTRVYRDVVGSVVNIRAFADGEVSQGSGFVYPRPGVVLTNEHVVGGVDDLELRFSRGEWRTARVVGTDAYSDLAVVRVGNPPGYATPLDLADDPVVGQEVVAIGSPFGFEKSLSVGVVSGVNRSIRTEAGFSIPGSVQTDAAVNPGNSGGPLVSLDGDVVGIIRSGGGENIGFAVSGTLIGRVVPALLARGEYDHPFMGVLLSTVTPSVAEANGLDRPRGVLVVEVFDDGPSAGILRGSGGEEEVDGVAVPTGGDVIVALDGTRVEALADLSTFLAFNTRPSETISVAVVRDGTRRTVDLTLGERPPPGRV